MKKGSRGGKTGRRSNETSKLRGKIKTRPRGIKKIEIGTKLSAKLVKKRANTKQTIESKVTTKSTRKSNRRLERKK